MKMLLLTMVTAACVAQLPKTTPPSAAVRLEGSARSAPLEMVRGLPQVAKPTMANDVKPTMANDVFHVMMSQVPSILRSKGLEQTGRLLPGTMLPLVRPLRRGAELKSQVEGSDGTTDPVSAVLASAGVHRQSEIARVPPERSSQQPTLEQLERLATELKRT